MRGQFHLSTLIVICLSFCIHHVPRTWIWFDDDNLPLQMTITSHFLTLFSQMVITIHPSNVILFSTLLPFEMSQKELNHRIEHGTAHFIE